VALAAQKRRSRYDRTNLHLHRQPETRVPLVWRGSIAGIDCVRGVALNGKFQTLKRVADVVFVEAA
jgi:hypothetical protein